MGVPPPPGKTVRPIVADEDQTAVASVLHLLRQDGHAVFHAYDALSATQLASALQDVCDLLITNTRVGGADGVNLIRRLRGKAPTLPVLYLANTGRSTPEMEARLPPGIPILREPFTAERLRAAVESLLDGGRPSP